LILDGYIPADKQREYLVRAERRAQAQLELIGDLLDLARLRNPDLCVEQELVDVAQELREACELMSGQAQEKGLQFSSEIPDDSVLVQTNPRHIRQLWSNLISNAVKYTQEGSVTVTMAEENNHVITRITDTGIGIAKEDRERIFEDFYRTKAAKTCSQMGTGLGLALVKRIVETYGGQVNIKSVVGKGSTFTVSLPTQLPVQPKPENEIL
jgi:cell cycle sensor histidine kinase DivJ